MWKLLIDQNSSVLVVELRDEENREVIFSAIDLIQKKLIWSSLSHQEKWWIGLDELRNGLVILHGYKDIQNPEHKGIYVYEARTGKYLWENSNYTFLNFQSGNIIAYDPHLAERVYVTLSAKDGKLFGDWEEQALSHPTLETNDHIVNSLHYTSENKYFEKISTFIEAFTGKRPEGALDYLEFGGKIISSFYFKAGENLVNYLLVMSENGEIMLQEEIGSEIKGIGIDTFFLYKDLLIFVKNKKELVIFEI